MQWLWQSDILILVSAQIDLKERIDKGEDNKICMAFFTGAILTSKYEATALLASLLSVRAVSSQTHA